MKFLSPLVKGKFLRRYKRFLVDFELDGQVITAHCPNSGSLKSIVEHAAHVWVSPGKVGNKLPYVLEMVELTDGTLVGTNTQIPNRLIATHGLSLIPGYTILEREVQCGPGTRLDFRLTTPNQSDLYVEVKNVSMRIGESAAFPDAVTERGLKHLETLSRLRQEGHRALLCFVVQRTDVTFVRSAPEIDPAYTNGLKRAIDNGVEVVSLGCHITPTGITIDKTLPFRVE